jgi:hypothetical protein
VDTSSICTEKPELSRGIPEQCGILEILDLGFGTRTYSYCPNNRIQRLVFDTVIRQLRRNHVKHKKNENLYNPWQRMLVKENANK